MKSREYLAHVKSLLDIEKQEDLAQYKRMVLDRSLKERVKKGTTWHPVAMQRMYIGMGEKLIVEVQKSGGKEQPHAFQPGGLVSVFGMLSDQEVGRARGVIASVRQKTMRVALSMETIPDWLTKSSLGVDLEFDDKTYQEMNRAIESMRDPGKNEDLATLREKMLGDGKPEFHKWDYTYHNATLNASQNEAVQKALEAREVAIIHGPPGTGKTTTLVEVIKETVHRESQVLVCAPSNTAVDLLTLKCWQAGMNVVRMGNPVRVDEALQELTLDGSIQAHEDYAALRKVRKEAEEVRRQAHKYKRNFGPEERRKRGEKMKEARELKAMAHQLEDYILFQVLQRAQVITATLIGAANQHLRKRDFTTVFIDEAGQALLPSSLIPLQYAKRVIMAGDHRQLPPTVKSFEADK
ncbi:MAG: AAA domain-containing protein, partial [Bacteroidota bacterium]